MNYRVTVDTGGTFTDVVVTDKDGTMVVGKAPTTPQPFYGVKDGLATAGEQLGLEVEDLLAGTDILIYATTHPTNAVLEKKVANTAFLVTEGFPDILVLREGGKSNPFDLSVPYPEPYIPRRLTFELPERIDSEGDVVRSLDEDVTRETLAQLRGMGVEAIAVCLLWSNVNGSHELRVGELIEETLPKTIDYSLSHKLNPIVREYRRASSTAIDASLKPFMGAHFQGIADGLASAGFAGEFLTATSLGGVMPVDEIGDRPVYSLRSGPSLAPIAGRAYGHRESDADGIIVCDAGGTSFEVSLIRNGAISFTRETWLGSPFTGHLVGFPSVDVRSIGAGGGSIGWVDSGGLLRVGPQSASAEPGPACYGRDGQQPTVTDAAVTLGYIDPEMFLGGRMHLDEGAARGVLDQLGGVLGLDADAAAEAVLAVANERMVRAIQEITINEGVDPKDSLIVAGGGAAGLSVASIARQLGCNRVLVPKAAGALSAVGGQLSDIVAQFSATHYTDTGNFDLDGTNDVLSALGAQVAEFEHGLQTRGVTDIWTDYLVDARYAGQVWELEVPLPAKRFGSMLDVEGLKDAFNQTHERIYAVSQPGAPVECLSWKVRMAAPVQSGTSEALLSGGTPPNHDHAPKPRRHRPAMFDGKRMETPRFVGAHLWPQAVIEGPAVIEEPTNTLVVPESVRMTVNSTGGYLMEV